MLDKVTVIAFDLDDTLWPCLPVIRHAEETLYRWLQQNYPRITERHDPAAMVTLRHEFSRRDDRYRVDMTALRREFLGFLAEMHDYQAADMVDEAFDVFFQARQQVEFYDDVLPSLERLSRRFRLGAISNGNASVEHVGLGHLFEHSLGAAEVQAAKPDPRIYGHFAERVGVEPVQILYVGDHPHYDVAGSLGAGYQAVWVNRDDSTWPQDLDEPRYQVRDLEELEALLAE
ncbi:MAG: HAD family hydrolase [Gammaproteobacteria bacterium]|nr:HAD family hydrolase [Gammaproteobacteria bacterium]